MLYGCVSVDGRNGGEESMQCEKDSLSRIPFQASTSRPAKVAAAREGDAVARAREAKMDGKVDGV